MGRIFYDLSLIVIGILRQGYHFGVATASYAADGYRAFGQRIDRWTAFYDRQKLRLQQRRSPAHAPPAIKKD